MVFEATGSAPGVASAIHAVKRGGVIVQIGNLPGGNMAAPVNMIMSKEIDFRGTFRFGKEFFDAVGMIADGSVDVLSIVTGEKPLANAPDALRLAFDRTQSMKVMIVA